MRTRIGWGSNFMSKFKSEGGMKDSELDAELTPATRASSRHVQSVQDLASLVKTAPRCSRRVRQESVDNNLRQKLDEQKQETWDMEIAGVYSINREEPTAERDITKIMHSMKRGKRSGRQRAKGSAPWAQPFGFLNSINSMREPQNHLGVDSKMMRRTLGRTKSLRVIDREAKEKENVGSEGDASSQSIIPAKAVSSDSSREEFAPEPPCDDSMAACVKFAVKLLKDEIPIPAGFSGVEDFFKQMMYRQNNIVIAGPFQSSLGRNC